MKKLLLATILSLAVAPVVAQGPAFAQSMGEKTGVNATLGIAPKTQDFVTQAAQAGMLEIETSKLALANSDVSANPELKAFADQMIDDHTRIAGELKTLIADTKLPVTVPPTLDKAHQEKVDKLKGLKGAAFVKEYKDMQLAGHKDAVSLFERYAKGGESEQLKAWGAKTLPTLKHHLHMIQDIDKKKS